MTSERICHFAILALLALMVAVLARGCQLDHDRALVRLDLKREAIKAGWKAADVVCIEVTYGAEFAQCRSGK